ncbi:hypothetical protein SAMN06269173_11387 [Hymenobacter mucosus]|uniref:Uncharacterized protein n=1 Tax=Hymenobacter mucosus TaxID=1411120 RepID=A0A239ALY1_9BACT|nr:hypothetical protein SAMN06269173_11387 [Hymenobacter mucosus]
MIGSFLKVVSQPNSAGSGLHRSYEQLVDETLLP